MKKELSDKELKQIYTLTIDEVELVKRRPKKTRVYFLILYKFYQQYRRFPDTTNISKQVLRYISAQLKIKFIDDNNVAVRTRKRILSEIRQMFDFKTVTSKTIDDLKHYLISEVLPVNHKTDFVKENISRYLAVNNLESLSDAEIKKIIKSSIFAFEQKLFKETAYKLDHDFSCSIDSWIKNNDNPPEGFVALNEIKKNPGAIGINSVFAELSKLRGPFRIRNLKRVKQFKRIIRARITLKASNFIKSHYQASSCKNEHKKIIHNSIIIF